MAENGRILAIDYGSKRIGLAISDPLAIIGSGFGTLSNDSRTMESIVRIVDEQMVRLVIVGLPLTLKGEEGSSVDEVKKFVHELKGNIKIPIELIDERLTSVMAADTIRQLGVGKKKREKNKGKIDELAAVHLLQGYLQSRPGGF